MHDDYLGLFLFVSYRFFSRFFSVCTMGILIFIGPADKSKDSDIKKKVRDSLKRFTLLYLVLHMTGSKIILFMGFVFVVFSI